MRGDVSEEKVDVRVVVEGGIMEKRTLTRYKGREWPPPRVRFVGILGDSRTCVILFRDPLVYREVGRTDPLW